MSHEIIGTVGRVGAAENDQGPGPALLEGLGQFGRDAEIPHVNAEKDDVGPFQPAQPFVERQALVQGQGELETVLVLEEFTGVTEKNANRIRQVILIGKTVVDLDEPYFYFLRQGKTPPENII